jgi:hypothetical protein
MLKINFFNPPAHVGRQYTGVEILPEQEVAHLCWPIMCPCPLIRWEPVESEADGPGCFRYNAHI